MLHAEVCISKSDCNTNDHFLANTNILCLNDDCLFHLFKFISFKDQLSLVCAHERFISVLQMHGRREMFENDFHCLTPLEIRYFFKAAGECLETLQLPADFEQNSCEFGFTLVKLFCSNLKSLSVRGHYRHISNIYFDRLRELLTNKPKLRTLRLEKLRVKDVFINLMTESELPQLEHLSIVDCNDFSGCGLKKLTNLRKLRLENLQKLNMGFLQHALSVMPNLYAFSYSEPFVYEDPRESSIKVLNGLVLDSKKLKILELNMSRPNCVHVGKLPELVNFTYGFRHSSRLGSAELTELLRQKKGTLESLKIFSDYNFEFNIGHCQLISQFTNLQKLHLPWRDNTKDCINVNDDALRTFCMLENLVEFKACGLQMFTKNGLLELVEKCRKLKWVNVQCTSIDNEFAIELIPVIREGSKRRITFLVFDTKMKAAKLPAIYSSTEMKNSIVFIFKDSRHLESYNNYYDDFEHDSGLIFTPFCRYW